LRQKFLLEPLPAPFKCRLFIVSAPPADGVISAGNGTEKANPELRHAEALARDEQIGNAAIRRRHLAPAARSA
jgi:hypothetical protein